MHVRALLDRKGDHVVTASPDDTLAAVVALLAEHRIGALVVSRNGRAIDGVVSERDVVRAVAAGGGEALGGPVSEVMTTAVSTCEPTTTVDELAELMTERRVRHIPVVVDGELGGLVSIGDVVKDRLAQLETEAQTLHDYIEYGR